MGMATRYVLDGTGITPGKERFSAPVLIGPRVHTASYTMRNGSLSPGGKSAEAWR
jgi:hypothetical protein